MGVADKMWDAVATVIRMNDKIERMAATIVAQQQKIENLTERVIRLETALEIGLARTVAPDRPPRKILRKE
jgi:phage-related minor tail protein